ncbi:hypothetical protein E2C01_055024 [Portunus trituberculatus]|uniref:Uncharacterized protein n=1 Tax=Portunus trituberculatus TaxID=210409 RepID=A0A5B7GQ48_PORTR|nr:hypothetical protein [Portunus trituberculatus]
MSLHPMRSRFSIDAGVAGSKIKPPNIFTHVNSDDWYYTTKQLFLSR